MAEMGVSIGIIDRGGQVELRHCSSFESRLALPRT
jgi:hypothetical protein